MYWILCVFVKICVFNIFVNAAYSPEYTYHGFSSLLFHPKDNLGLKCSSDDTNITWNVRSTLLPLPMFDSNISTTVSTEENVTTSNLNMALDWYNDNSEVWCTTSNSVTNFTRLHLEDLAVLVNFTTCTKHDFKKQKGCFLTCTVYSKQYADIRWTYHFSDSEMQVILQTSHLKPGLQSDSLYLDLKNYRAGFYSCEVRSDETPTVVVAHTFQTNTNSSTAKGIKDSCNSDMECVALYSKCMHGVCMCQEQFPIPSSNKKNATTCLAKKYLNEACILNKQCQSTDPVFYCKNGYCRCKGNVKYIEELETEQCIMPAWYGENCTNNEDCQMFDENMECVLGNCYCDAQYFYIRGNGCVLATEYYNTIRVSIISLIIFILAIAIILIFAHMQRKLLRRSNEIRQQIHIRYLFGNGQNELHGNISEVPFPPSYDEVLNAETPPPTYAEFTCSSLNVKTQQKVICNALPLDNNIIESTHM